MKGSIDRIESDKIIVVFDNKSIKEYDRNLYQDFKEGDRIIENNGTLLKNEEETTSRKQRLLVLQNKLFRR